MYCWSCGKENPDSASFCGACGKELASSGNLDMRTGKRIHPHLFVFSLWIGILFLFVGVLSITIISALPAMIITGIGIASIIFAIVYFLISLYRCWNVLHGFSPRTTPAKAVGFSLIPFFNIYWVFVSIYCLAVDANAFAEQGGSNKKINETLSIVTCFILILPFINLLALILLTFLIYQWADFYNASNSPVTSSFTYPVSNKDEYLQGEFNFRKVFVYGLLGITLIIISAEIIKTRRQEKACTVAQVDLKLLFTAAQCYFSENPDASIDNTNQLIAYGFGKTVGVNINVTNSYKQDSLYFGGWAQSTHKYCGKIYTIDHEGFIEEHQKGSLFVID